MQRHTTTLRWLLGLLTPGVVLLAAWAMHQDRDVYHVLVAPYSLHFCFAAIAMAALIAWYYDYSGLLCIALALGLSAWFVRRAPAEADVAMLANIFMLPLNFALFGWLRERGVMGPSGLLKLGLVGVQALGVALLAEMPAGGLEEFLAWGERPWGAMAMTQLPSFVAAALILLALIFVRRTRLEPGLLWALAAASQGVSREHYIYLELYWGAAGLILALAVLEQGFEIAYRDDLTGLPNRRAFNQRLERLGRRYTIAMCDVDHFKTFNDAYGHDAGDQVLRMVAGRLSRIPGGGRAYRYGGEEFTVVFRGRSAEEAQPFLEALRQEIAGRDFVLRAPDRPKKKPRQPLPAKPRKAVTITISIGIAERSDRDSRPELVVDSADAALYLAKQSGRNRVMLAERAGS